MIKENFPAIMTILAFIQIMLSIMKDEYMLGMFGWITIALLNIWSNDAKEKENEQ